MLNEYELEDVLENVHAINTKSFPLVFKLRVIEMYKCMYKQERWNSVNKARLWMCIKYTLYYTYYKLYHDILPKSLLDFVYQCNL